jgi:lysophospholipase L1-like esterase
MPTSLSSLLGRSPAWFPITGAITAVPNRRYIATVTAATDVTLPTFAAGDAFMVANSRDSTAAVRVVVGAGNTINHPLFATGDNITVQPGESVSLVAESATELELVTAGAVGPPGPAGVASTPVNETLRALLENAALSMRNNPRTRGTMPASLAPTITIGTGTVPGGFTRVYAIEAANSPFASGGGLPTNSGGVTSFPTCTPSGSTQVGRHWRVETILDGDEVAFLLDSATADGYRFIVDGQYVSATGTTSAAGSLRYYTLTFPARGRYRIAVEGHTTLRFDEARVPDDCTLLPPERANPLRVIVVGDSNIEAYPIVLKGDGIGAVLGDQLGVLDVWASGVFGTGFIATNGGANYTYAQRRTDWTTRSPDVLLLCMSINDIVASATQAQIKTAVALELTQARAALPGVPIFVLGVVASEDYLSANSLLTLAGQQETGAQEAVNEANDSLIRMIPTINAAIDSPFTGTPGTGNWNLYVDGTTHATPAGQLYGGQWLAHRLVDAVASMAGLPTPAFAPPSLDFTAQINDRVRGTVRITVGTTAPSSPAVGDIWIDTN